MDVRTGRELFGRITQGMESLGMESDRLVVRGGGSALPGADPDKAEEEPLEEMHQEYFYPRREHGLPLLHVEVTHLPADGRWRLGLHDCTVEARSPSDDVMFSVAEREDSVRVVFATLETMCRGRQASPRVAKALAEVAATVLGKVLPGIDAETWTPKPGDRVYAFDPWGTEILRGRVECVVDAVRKISVRSDDGYGRLFFPEDVARTMTDLIRNRLRRVADNSAKEVAEEFWRHALPEVLRRWYSPLGD